MSNFHFYLSQVGLVAAGLFGMAIVHLTAQNPATRKIWYYYFIVWFISGICMNQVAKNAVADLTPEQIDVIWLPQLSFGIERILVYIAYRYSIGGSLSVRLINFVNRWVAVTSVVCVIVFVGYNKYYLERPSPSIERQLNQLSREVMKNRTVAAADTQKLAYVQRQNDTLRDNIARIQETSVLRERQIAGFKKQLTILTRLIMRLEKLLMNVGANVERTRRSVPIPGKIDARPPLFESTPAYKAPPYQREPDKKPPKPSRRPGKNQESAAVDQPDSTDQVLAKTTVPENEP